MNTAALARCFALSISCFASPLLASESDRMPLREIIELELEVEKWKMRFDAPPPQEELRREIGRRAETLDELLVGEVTAPTRLELPGGGRSPIEVVQVDVSGRASFDAVAVALWRLWVMPWRAYVESLELTAADGHTVRMRARLSLPYHSPSEASPAPPSGDVFADMITRRNDLRSTRDLFVAVANGSDPETLAGRFARMMKDARSESLGVASIRLEKELRIEGVVGGAAARASLRPLLEEALGRPASIELTGTGPCRSFTATLPVAEPVKKTVANYGEPAVEYLRGFTGNGFFISPSESLTACRRSPEAGAKAFVVEGKTGGVTLKLKAADASQLFHALWDLTGGSFVLAGDVEGPLDVSITNASLEEIVASLAKHGVWIGTPPLRGVSFSKLASADRSQVFSGDKVSLQLDEQDLRRVLCLFAEITGLEFRVDPDLSARVSLYATEVEWDRAVDDVLTLHGLGYTIVDGRVVVGRRGAAPPSDVVDACAAGIAAPSRRLATATLKDVAAGDVELAGIAGAGGTWRAYAYLPSGRIAVVSAGDELFDAKVTAVSGDGVTLSRQNGERVVVKMR